MNTTFGQRLQHFSNAIDIVEDETFKKVIALVEEYLGNVLNIQIVRTMAENRHDDGSVDLVKHQLDMVDPFESIRLTEGLDESQGQMPFAYKVKKPLWIVNEIAGGVLNDTDARYVDLWSGEANIPRYYTNTADAIKTSIIIPIKNGENRVYGVVNFETSEYLDVTEIAKHELELVSQTISTLYQLKRARTVQSRSTSCVIGELTDSLKGGGYPKLTKPKIFLASATNGDDEVMSIILETLKEFSDKVDVQYWKEIYDSGNITINLVERIASCQYGICYLSESDERGDEYRYKDNPNVVFEAGMFHGRLGNSTQSPYGWLPVREESSPPPPFDFAAERMVVVCRDDEHRIIPETLQLSLRRHIQQLIGEV